jgi:4-hydroxy-tetrahydrodipicolinate synthase
MSKPLRGILAAMCTPFDRAGQLDEGALRDLTDGLIAAGVHGLITCGSTGEFSALSVEERKRVSEVVAKQADGRVPIVPQTGSTSLRTALELTRHAKSFGADAVMVVPPYYEPLSEDELYDYFRDIAEAAGIPIMVYNIPSCTGMNLKPDFVARMAREIENVRYVKDSSADLSQVSELIYAHHDTVTVFNGWDTIVYPGLALGSQGAVWGAANCLPKQCADLFNLCAAGHLGEAKALWDRMWPVQQFLVGAGYVAAVKAGATLVGFPVGDPRRPLRPLPPGKVKELQGLLEAAGATVSQGAGL